MTRRFAALIITGRRVDAPEGTARMTRFSCSRAQRVIHADDGGERWTGPIFSAFALLSERHSLWNAFLAARWTRRIDRFYKLEAARRAGHVTFNVTSYDPAASVDFDAGILRRQKVACCDFESNK